MKPSHHSTPAQAGPGLATISTWVMNLYLLHQRLAPHFARPSEQALLDRRSR